MNPICLQHTFILLALWMVALTSGCRPERGSGSAEAREQKAVALVDNLISGRFADARTNFNTLMRFSLSEAKLKTVWTTLTTMGGEFEKRTWINHTVHDGYDVVYVGLKYEKAPFKAKVVFSSGDKITGLFFQPSTPPWKVPSYVQTNSFTEKEITFGLPNWKLQGTLTLPNSDTRPPVAVLVHGSGPHDRDETIGPNKVFKDFAWGLASRGVAVFRYEKRTKIHAGKLARAKTFTMKEETVDDAVAAVKLLRDRSDIDADRVYLIGHNQGGYCAPRIARHVNLAGFVSLAGNSRPLEELIIEQTEYLMKLDPARAKDLKGMRLAADQVKKLDASDAQSRKILLNAPMSYWFDLRNYDPVAAAKEFKGQIFIVHAGRDYQVNEKDFHRWTNGLAAHPKLYTRAFTNLNHLMIPGTGMSKPVEYQQAGHVDANVIAAIADWIKE
ncbi:MAG: DUF3887 domain-containing protein [Limisphaerales bacterium]